MGDTASAIAQAGQSGGSQLRIGTVTGYNQGTGALTVDVAGADLPNVAYNPAYYPLVGDTVAVMNAGPTWYVMGSTVTSAPHLASSAAVVTTETTTSYRTYVDLTTPGPSVTVNISSSGKALAFWSCRASMTFTAANALVGAGVSVGCTGATTVAPSDDWVAAWESQVGNSNSNTASTTLSRFHLFTGLNPGSTTFSMQYATWSNGQTANFWARELTLLPF